jgi:hypothetical protein
MNGVKPTQGWQTVKSRTEEKKKKQEEKRKQQVEQKKDRLGATAKSDVFAVFDRVYQEEAAAAAKPTKPQLHGDYKGAYAHLANETPAVAGAASDSDASDEEAAASTNGTGEAAAAAAKAKKPKVKKPKILFATIAQSKQQQGRRVGVCAHPHRSMQPLHQLQQPWRLDVSSAGVCKQWP